MLSVISSNSAPLFEFLGLPLVALVVDCSTSGVDDSGSPMLGEAVLSTFPLLLPAPDRDPVWAGCRFLVSGAALPLPGGTHC